MLYFMNSGRNYENTNGMTSSLPCFGPAFNTRVPSKKEKRDFRRFRLCHSFLPHDACRLFYLVLRTSQVSVFLVKIYIFYRSIRCFYVNFFRYSTFKFDISSHRHRKRSRSREKSHKSSGHKSSKQRKMVSTEGTKHNEEVLQRILQSVTKIKTNLAACNSRISGVPRTSL